MTHATEHAVYIHRSKDGAALYVGMSLNVLHRLAVHSGTARWYSNVHRIDIEWFPTKREAQIREHHLILELRPPHNQIASLDGEFFRINPISSWAAPAEIDELRSRAELMKTNLGLGNAAKNLGVSIHILRRFIRGGKVSDRSYSQLKSQI